jgi:hypothetical protein
LAPGAHKTFIRVNGEKGLSRRSLRERFSFD